MFNFNDDYQASTRLYLEGSLLETIHHTKLLGTIVSTDLKWQENTEMLTRKAYQRMQILHRLSPFKVSQEDMVEIYVLYIRSILELNCQVWHYSLTESERYNLERVQKIACRIILKTEYSSYSEALEILKLERLEDRRTKLCLTFAKRCLKHPAASKMFPSKPVTKYDTRKHEKFEVQFAKTSRLKNSAIPQLQRALNANFNKTGR